MPTARNAIPGVSPGRGLLIPHGYLHPGKKTALADSKAGVIVGNTAVGRLHMRELLSELRIQLTQRLSKSIPLGAFKKL